MPEINNQIYDQPEDIWWDENSSLYLLKTMVNPWRVPYFRQILTEIFSENLSGGQLLDIGCGGGYLSEEFARLGLQTTGIDLSPNSIQAAKSHARQQGLDIRYQVGAATEIDFQDHQFDIVSCCDVLEHIDNWPDAIREISRVLRPGGLFLFDTINRTLISYLTMIFGLEIFPLTRIFAPGTHIWRMFITPEELSSELDRHGLAVMGLSGGSIPVKPHQILGHIRQYKTGNRSAAELGKSLGLELTNDLSQNYLGAARKEDLSAHEAGK